MKNLSIECGCGAAMNVQNLYDDELRLLVDKFNVQHKGCLPKVNIVGLLRVLVRIETAILNMPQAVTVTTELKAEKS